MNVRSNKIFFLLSFILIFQISPFMQVVNSDAVTKKVQISFSSVDWKYIEPENFDFNFTIKTVNPFTSNYPYHYSPALPPYSVEIYYIGNYKIENLGKGGSHLFLEASIRPGTSYNNDQEGINVLNYSSTIIPDGIYIFSVIKVFGSGVDYSNSTLVMNQGKASVYYNTSIYSTGISFFIRQNLFLIGFLISLMIAIPISYFRLFKKPKKQFYNSSVRKRSSIIFKFINGKLKKQKYNKYNEDTKFDRFFDDIKNELED